jgi:hypothetical protein
MTEELRLLLKGRDIDFIFPQDILPYLKKDFQIPKYVLCGGKHEGLLDMTGAGEISSTILKFRPGGKKALARELQRKLFENEDREKQVYLHGSCFRLEAEMEVVKSEVINGIRIIKEANLKNITLILEQEKKVE